MSDRIKSRPTDGLTYSPAEEKYWDREALDGEIERVYDVCHGCRLCFNLCPSFPALFDAVDEHNGEVRKLSSAEREHVVDLCYGCKLCHVKCPYTPEDGHDFQLDFPRLMLRARAVRTRERGGVKLREKMLGNPDKLGRMASHTPRLANWGNHNKLQRSAMQAFLGVHKDKKLPDFAEQTLQAWIEEHGLPEAPETPNARVALFYTCFVNYNNPAPGKALLKVFEKNACEVTCPEQNCCGMPALDGGDMDLARREAQANVDRLLPLARDGYKIAAINPTCSLMMRREYPPLLGTDEARELAESVVDPHELLFQLKRDKKFNRDFKSTPGRIGYHVPCHLKAQAIGFRSRDLMRLIPGSDIEMVDACTAHDGTWAMKKEYFDLSMKWGKKCFDEVQEAEADVVTTDCPLAAIQIEQGAGVRPIHPAEVLSRAYEADGFERPVPQEEEKG